MRVAPCRRMVYLADEFDTPRENAHSVREHNRAARHFIPTLPHRLPQSATTGRQYNPQPSSGYLPDKLPRRLTAAAAPSVYRAQTRHHR